MFAPAIALAWCVVSLPARSTEPSDANHAAKPAMTDATTANVTAGVTAMQASAPRAATSPTIDLDAYDPARKVAGERSALRGAIPTGVITFAKTLVNYPMGAERTTEIDGQRYVFVLERHYHPQGFVGAPNGWHKGVTAYALR